MNWTSVFRSYMRRISRMRLATTVGYPFACHTLFWLTILASPASLRGQSTHRIPEIQTSPSTPAPTFDGGAEWLNASGPISLQDLRGKIVILDFWTYCCINCMQTLPDLQRIEREFAEEVVVIGVHAPKFAGERDTKNVQEAILRYNIEHPVVNDANAVVARKYGVSSWPTLRFIDPTGNVFGSHEGEATYGQLNTFIKKAVAKYRRAGVLDETPLHFALERERAAATPLRFPGKVLADLESKRLFIADSGHHRIVITTLDGELRHVIGSGQIGRRDGAFAEATFSSPQGLALRGRELFVADTENHAIRRIDLQTQRVTTVAGTGEQAPTVLVRSTNRPLGIALASPWDLAIDGDELYIAMAGSHQIWRLKLTNQRLHTYAGNGVEDIVDGPLLPRMAFQSGAASFAQPSGLASDGRVLYVADSEGSSIRAVALNDRGRVATLLGTAALPQVARLFTFGDRDGAANQALLQHPLAVAFHDDQVFIADTYNNKIKRLDLHSSRIETIAGDGQPGHDDAPAQFNEPGGLSWGGSMLYVADTNNHAIRRINTAQENRVETLKFPELQPPAAVAAGELALPASRKVNFGTHHVAKPRELAVEFELNLPAGAKLNADAPPTCQIRQTDGDSLLSSSDIQRRITLPATSLPLRLELPLHGQGTATVEITLAYYYCESGSQSVCRLGTATWTGQITTRETGDNRPLRLRL